LEDNIKLDLRKTDYEDSCYMGQGQVLFQWQLLMSQVLNLQVL